MDCFYVQCHLAVEPQFKGIPSVVVQYSKSRETLYKDQFNPNMKRGGEGIIGQDKYLYGLGSISEPITKLICI